MRAALIAIVAGCYSPSPPSGAPCGEGDVCPGGQTCIAGFCGGRDATDADEGLLDILVGPDGPPACQSWGARHFDACGLPQPIGDLVLTQSLSDYSWDTDDGNLRGKMNTPVAVVTTVLQQTGGPDVLLVSVNNFTVEAGVFLDISGTRPILIAVNGTATIHGDIDADASGSSPGPGGIVTTATTECPGTQVGNNGSPAVLLGPPATGAGGGGFGGAGGDGGNMGAANGNALASPPALIRGGCPGGVGGSGSIGTTAARGAGGGALVISARFAIVVSSTGNINAGGGGGGGGRASFGGGGGGGSGGLIGLDAPMLTIDGTLAANGGGGGGGASDTNVGIGGNNGPGSDSEAAGGSGAATSMVGVCSRGGNGGAGGDPAGDTGASSLCGGGGGGGGVGFVLFWSDAPTVNASATVSPAAQSGP